MPVLAASAARAAARSPFESRIVLALLAAVTLVGFYDWHGLRAIVTTLRLPDTDDVMRLADVRALLDGQGWFDTVQHRLGPLEGTPSHWSRLVDAPLAGLILVLTPFLGRSLAEGVTAAAWPPALFALYAGLLFAAVRRSFGARAAWLALFAAGQSATLANLFAFGRIDHHNVQVCAIFGLVLLLARPGVRPALLAGGLGAFSLAVGLETLPFVAAAGLALAVQWIRRGAAQGAALTGFGLGLALVGPLLFAGQTDPALWKVSACDALSPPWLFLTGTAGIAALFPLLAPPSVRARLLLAAGFGIVLAAGFATLFPDCVAGPFGHLPPFVVTEWLEKVGEARSVWSHLREDPALALSNAMPVLLAGLVAAWRAWRSPDNEDARLLGFAAVMLAVGSVIVQAQLRGVYIAGAFVPLVAGPILDRGLSGLREPSAVRYQTALLVLLGLAMLGRGWVAAASLPRSLGVTRAVEEPATACNAPEVVAALDALPPGRVLAPIDLGPTIILHTRHTAIAGPYHRDVSGLEASLRALGGDEANVHRALAASRADYLVLCVGTASDPPAVHPAFATLLAHGRATVPWLRPMPSPGTDLKVWRFVSS